jgi:CheY-like chemotaxis protein
MGDGPLKVLYVEDEADDILFMKRAMRAVCPEIELSVAHDGEEAVQVLSHRRPPPDWIVLDLKMPRRSGLEVLEWIRSHPTLKDLKVTVLSSSPEQSDVRRVEELGIDRYIVKPVNYLGLLEIVRSLCKRWGRVEGPPPEAMC